MNDPSQRKGGQCPSGKPPCYPTTLFDEEMSKIKKNRSKSRPIETQRQPEPIVSSNNSVNNEFLAESHDTDGPV